MRRLTTYIGIVAALVVAVVAVPLAQAADPSPAELKALEIRGQALNQMCVGSSGEISATLCGRLATGQVTQVTRSSGFDWSDFGIGAGAMLGFVLLAGGIAAGVHYGRRRSAWPRTVS